MKLVGYVSLAIFGLALIGCDSMPAKIEYREVKVIVKEPCLKERPAPPVYVVGTTPYPGDVEAANMLASDLEAAKKYGRDWEAAAVGCVSQ